jgi:hypothetical protein
VFEHIVFSKIPNLIGSKTFDCWICFKVFFVFYSVLVDNFGFSKIPDLVGSKTFDVLVFCGFLQRFGN